MVKQLCSSILYKAVEVSYKVINDKYHFVECFYHNGKIHTSLVGTTDDDNVRTIINIDQHGVDAILFLHRFMPR